MSAGAGDGPRVARRLTLQERLTFASALLTSEQHLRGQRAVCLEVDRAYFHTEIIETARLLDELEAHERDSEGRLKVLAFVWEHPDGNDTAAYPNLSAQPLPPPYDERRGRVKTRLTTPSEPAPAGDDVDDNDR